MKKGKKKTPTLQDAAKAYAMQCNIIKNVTVTVADEYSQLSIEELEKKFDLAGARVTYAQEQRDHWQQEAYARSREFNRIVTAYKRRKHGFTDEQVKGNPPTSSAVWTYTR